jgi:VRR-NUC domain
MSVLTLKPAPPPLERHEQEAYFSWLRYLRHKGDKVSEYAYAIPNGAYRGFNRKAAAIQTDYLKKQGMKNGVPDVCLAIPVAPYHGLYIELKRIGAPAPSTAQLGWHERLRKMGYWVGLCYGFEQAQHTTLWYLGQEAPP